MNPDDFKLIKGYKSYVNNPEITDLSPAFLVKGSRNVLLDYALRIISRNGYILYGAAAPANSTGIKGSYEWDTSTAKQFSLKSSGSILEFYYGGIYRTLMTGLATPYLEFAKIWDDVEKIDVLLFVMGDTNTYKWSGGVTRIASGDAVSLKKQGVLTAQTTIAFVAGTPGTIPAQITDSGSGFVIAGFLPGDTLYVTGSVSNNRNFTIATVTAGVITLIMSDVLITEAAGASVTVHNGEPTWTSARFLNNGTRKITLNGVDYAYTGGENTDTLTGLSGLPAVIPGDITWQTIIILPNDTGDFPASFKQDLIGVQLNQLILASTKSQEVYGSSTSDYTDFGLTSPRAPGDPFKVTMDNYATCIVPMDNTDQTSSSLMFGGGTNEFFKLSFQLSQDNLNELVRMIKLKTASGSGLISKSALGSIKNAVAYISREPTLDTLGTIEQTEGSTNVPLSDPVKNDFDSYNFSGAHIKYWKRSVYIALPAEGLVLIYDLQRRLWQPPQSIPVSRLSIIDDWLYGHCSYRNETYRLFTGTNDNGNFIPQVARFAYNNGGRRDRLKNMSEYWSDGYISPNGTLNMTQYLGFEGNVGKKMMRISGGDSNVVNEIGASPLGSEPLGTVPLGGSTSGPIPGLDLGATTLLRFWQVDTMDIIDYTEEFAEYTMNTLDGQFALVAHGSNSWDAGTSPVTHKK